MFNAIQVTQKTETIVIRSLVYQTQAQNTNVGIINDCNENANPTRIRRISLARSCKTKNVQVSQSVQRPPRAKKKAGSSQTRNVYQNECPPNDQNFSYENYLSAASVARLRKETLVCRILQQSKEINNTVSKSARIELRRNFCNQLRAIKSELVNIMSAKSETSGDATIVEHNDSANSKPSDDAENILKDTPSPQKPLESTPKCVQQDCSQLKIVDSKPRRYKGRSRSKNGAKDAKQINISKENDNEMENLVPNEALNNEKSEHSNDKDMKNILEEKDKIGDDLVRMSPVATRKCRIVLKRQVNTKKAGTAKTSPRKVNTRLGKKTPKQTKGKGKVILQTQQLEASSKTAGESTEDSEKREDKTEVPFDDTSQAKQEDNFEKEKNFELPTISSKESEDIEKLKEKETHIQPTQDAEKSENKKDEVPLNDVPQAKEDNFEIIQKKSELSSTSKEPKVLKEKETHLGPAKKRNAEKLKTVKGNERKKPSQKKNKEEKNAVEKENNNNPTGKTTAVDRLKNKVFIKKASIEIDKQQTSSTKEKKIKKNNSKSALKKDLKAKENPKREILKDGTEPSKDIERVSEEKGTSSNKKDMENTDRVSEEKGTNSNKKDIKNTDHMTEEKPTDLKNFQYPLLRGNSNSRNAKEIPKREISKDRTEPSKDIENTDRVSEQKGTNSNKKYIENTDRMTEEKPTDLKNFQYPLLKGNSNSRKAKENPKREISKDRTEPSKDIENTDRMTEEKGTSSNKIGTEKEASLSSQTLSMQKETDCKDNFPVKSSCKDDLESKSGGALKKIKFEDYLKRIADEEQKPEKNKRQLNKNKNVKKNRSVNEKNLSNGNCHKNTNEKSMKNSIKDADEYKRLQSIISRTPKTNRISGFKRPNNSSINNSKPPMVKRFIPEKASLDSLEAFKQITPNNNEQVPKVQKRPLEIIELDDSPMNHNGQYKIPRVSEKLQSTMFRNPFRADDEESRTQFSSEEIISTNHDENKTEVDPTKQTDLKQKANWEKVRNSTPYTAEKSNFFENTSTVSSLFKNSSGFSSASTNDFTQDDLSDWDTEFMDIQQTQESSGSNKLQNRSNTVSPGFVKNTNRPSPEKLFHFEISNNFPKDRDPRAKVKPFVSHYSNEDRCMNYMLWKLKTIDMPPALAEKPDRLEVLLSKPYDDPRLRKYKHLIPSVSSKVLHEKLNEQNKLFLLKSIKDSIWYQKLSGTEKHYVSKLLLFHFMRSLVFYHKECAEDNEIPFNIDSLGNAIEIKHFLNLLNLTVNLKGEIVKSNTTCQYFDNGQQKINFNARRPSIMEQPLFLIPNQQIQNINMNMKHQEAFHRCWPPNNTFSGG